MSASDYKVKTGGLFRCCLKNLADTLGINKNVPLVPDYKIGDIIECEYCGAHVVLFVRCDGTRVWERAEKEK